MRSDRAGLPVDAALLETELPSKQRRASLLAWLLGMAEDRLAGRHCSEAQIKQQIIAWTTPCLSAFGEFEASLPCAGKDVTAVPGSVDLQPVEALARHLQIALIACALERDPSKGRGVCSMSNIFVHSLSLFLCFFWCFFSFFRGYCCDIHAEVLRCPQLQGGENSWTLARTRESTTWLKGC